MSKKKKPGKVRDREIPRKEHSSIADGSIIQNKVSELRFMYNRAFWLKSAGILLLSFAIYFATANYGYLLDDKIVITSNQFTKEGFGGIYKLLTTESMTGYFGEQMNLVEGNRYRPLSLVTFAMEFGLTGGMHPGISHIINVLLYGISGIILLWGLTILFSYRPERTKSELFMYIPFAASLIFISHPLHVEAVANIKGRDEIMAMLFSLLTLGILVQPGILTTKRLVWAGVCFFLGLLSKENTITFLAAIPLAMYFFNRKGMAKAILALGVTTVLYLILRFSVSGVPKLNQTITDIMNNPFYGFSGSEKLATIFYTLGLYIKLLFYPHPMTHDYYPYAIGKMNFGDWQVLLSLFLYLGLTIYALLKMSKKYIVSFSILYFLVTLSIVSNLVVNVGTFMNDRFIYMSSLGFALFLAWFIWWVTDKVPASKRLFVWVALVALPVTAYSVRSLYRVPAWKDAIALNRAAMPASENSARANSFLATALFEEYKVTSDPNKKMALLNEARPYAEKAVKIYPTYMNGNMMKAGIAAETYAMDRDLDKLLVEFHEIGMVRPDMAYFSTYLEYLNKTPENYPKLIPFYITLAKELISKNTKSHAKYANVMLGYGLSIAPGNAEMSRLRQQATQIERG